MKIYSRVYFFSGLVVITICLITASILDMSQKVELSFLKWVVLCVYIGAIMIIIPVADYSGILKYVSQARIRGLAILGTGAAMVIFLLIASSIFIKFCIGLSDQCFSELILMNSALLLSLPVAFVLVGLYAIGNKVDVDP